MLYTIIFGDINNNSTYTNANTDGLCCFRYEQFIHFLSSVLQHERDKILTMLTMLSNPTNMQHILSCLRSPSVEIRKPNYIFNGPNPTLNSKSSSSQDHLFQAWRHPHSSRISCLGFIMTMVIVISFARKCKTVPNDYAPELLTRIVQSLTKLNDKI